MLSCSSWFIKKVNPDPRTPATPPSSSYFFPSSCRNRQLPSSGRASAETTTHRMSSKFSTCQSDHEFLTYTVVRKLWDPIGCHATTWQATISAKGHRRDLQSISWWNGSSRETPTLKRPRKRLVAEKHGIQDVCLAMETGRSFGILKGFRCVWNTQYPRFLWVAFGTRWRSLENIGKLLMVPSAKTSADCWKSPLH